MKIVRKIESSDIISAVTGIVVHGRGIGKLVGLPTADLKIDAATALPPQGVYTSRILAGHETCYGLTHIGPRPTIDNDPFVTIETYILDFHRDLYGEELLIHLCQWLRPTEKFAELSQLLRQIQADCQAARDYWGISATQPPFTQDVAPPFKTEEAASGSGLSIDLKTRRILIHHQDIHLSIKEFGILYLLYSHPETAFTKEAIYEAIWQAPALGRCHAVENTIFQIRRRLKPYASGHDYIRTLPGYGYIFHPKT